ncbi:hypothetical protein B0H13DRAFT_1852340 [Mycena leptocephala]|nr:hypothetical protein B0H13DRAFT_1852340 [Mycena leptocephala]
MPLIPESAREKLWTVVRPSVNNACPELGDGGRATRSASIGSLSPPSGPLAPPPGIGSLVEAYDWGETHGTMSDDVDLQFLSMLPSTALTQPIVNQISSKLPAPYKTRAQVRECYDLLQSAGCIAEPPSASDIGRCLSVLQA